jgi:hypothetical protein
MLEKRHNKRSSEEHSSYKKQIASCHMTEYVCNLGCHLKGRAQKERFRTVFWEEYLDLRIGEVTDG